MNELEQAYSNAKRQQRMSAKQTRRLKRMSRIENRKHTRQFWLRTTAWATSCCAVALIGSLSLQNTLNDFELFLTKIEPAEFNTEQYQSIETHNLVEGEYLTTIAQQKQQLDNSLEGAKATLTEIHQTYGKLIHSEDGAWFIADCQNATLIEVRKSVLDELNVPKMHDAQLEQGVLLALSRNNQGQLLKIAAPTEGNNLHACP
ncbi:hypothetical protein N474_03570 [Pseudoalteromonas luteoviolacea CPMOR-2]|uniref:Uncharacterized protein n=1 Tax=Pseudoalteromonas luteoviolacea DSM 6061 TaxID=1365250 RepID=A0A166VEV9_9GAMM|nr:hypothetical protein [Pseudoalteromonas luteoviolacea]KZN32610.1 hypothetical protein N475_21480 [Pseudoalteromonas luteoviolacea DSM 6061]KZN50467.1 hypothetical protein N474_03570 [Pseudoalteromonas luteoviolacea CPMOR-2]MBE0385080.1 hypothetical protein [Pseudoalteromonas luteoviolacea DSM 6061]